MASQNKELASLREQLKVYQEKEKAFADIKPGYLDRPLDFEKVELRRHLAKHEEVIRELTSSLVYIVKTLGALTLPQDEPEALAYYEALKAIEKAKSLTTKDK